MHLLAYSSFLLLTSYFVLAHPGHDVAHEAAERAEFLRRNPQSVKSCASKLRTRDFITENSKRRMSLYTKKRKASNALSASRLSNRDVAAYNFTHAYDGSSISLQDDENLLFADNSSCILQPEVTEGPYFVNGELIRQDVTEDQEGIPLTLDIQIIDTSTCEPIPALYLDLWHCNSTGVYSGVSASGNGNGDASNLNNTFLRGIQQTDPNGVVQFQTLFPGHYTGRATHIHILAHSINDTTVRLNNTLMGSNGTTVTASHVGQLFFDQDLISQVEATSAYSDNTQEITLNVDDTILASEAETTDPFVEYIMLGDSVEDGILAWISIGIDPTNSKEISVAATHYDQGGVANANAMGGGGGAPLGGNGTMSGTPPDSAGTMSGVIPSTSTSG